MAKHKSLTMAEAARLTQYIMEHKPQFNGKTLAEMSELVSARLKLSVTTKTLGNICEQVGISVAETTRLNPVATAHERINIIGRQMQAILEELGHQPLPEFAARFLTENGLIDK